MQNNQILITCTSPEQLIELLRPMFREEMKKLLEQQEEKLISPAETCKIFVPNITKATLKKWTRLGLVNEYRLGGRIFYKQSEILEKSKTLKRYKNT